MWSARVAHVGRKKFEPARQNVYQTNNNNKNQTNGTLQATRILRGISIFGIPDNIKDLRSKDYPNKSNQYLISMRVIALNIHGILSGEKGS